MDEVSRARAAGRLAETACRLRRQYERLAAARVRAARQVQSYTEGMRVLQERMNALLEAARNA